MRQCELVVLVAVVVLSLISVPGHADTFGVPIPYATIQDGIDAASEGDTVLVAPGTYTGTGSGDRMNLHGVNMVVMSETGALDTIVDCEGSGRGFRASSGEDSTSVIRGFTFTNGVNSGILIGSGAAVIIEDCIISNNIGNNGGGIEYGYAETPGVIRNCIFFGNAANHRAGGIMCDHGDPPDHVAPVIRDCIFYDNDATSSSYGGGAIFCNNSSPTIIGCTMVGNAGAPGAGGIHAVNCYPVVRRTVVAFSTQGAGIYNVDADHCIIYGNAGDDALPHGERENLDIDPLFCDIGSWDLTVCANSPCLPGAPENPWGEHLGAYDSGCGDCDSAVQESTWGAIKAMYLNP